MDDIGLLRRVLNWLERRWAGWFAKTTQLPQSSTFCDDPLRSPQLRRLLEGSLRPPTQDRTFELPRMT
jgi:hypothetical protein